MLKGISLGVWYKVQLKDRGVSGGEKGASSCSKPDPFHLKGRSDEFIGCFSCWFGLWSTKFNLLERLRPDSQQNVAASLSQRWLEAKTSSDSERTLLSLCTRATAHQCQPASTNRLCKLRPRQLGVSEVEAQMLHMWTVLWVPWVGGVMWDCSVNHGTRPF